MGYVNKMPKKMSKPDKAMLIAVIVIAVLAAGFFLKDILFKPLAILQDIESQLKSEYTTYWSDATDGYLDTRFTQPISISNRGLSSHYETDKFTCDIDGGARVSMGDTSGYAGVQTYNYIQAYTSGVSGFSCTSKKDFKGQELVILISSASGGIRLMGYTLGIGQQLSDPRSPSTIIWKPRTFNPNIYDIYISGLLTYSGVDYSNGLFINFGGGGDNIVSSGIVIEHIGFKVLYSCDLSPNERWIQTQWIGSVSMDDIIKKDGLIPTKFCKETRPFVLRDIQQGETSIYPDPIPLFNRGCVIPNIGDCKTPAPLPNNQFIVINYAVYQVAGLENPTTGTQAYKCIQRDLNYKCLGWTIEEVIKPVEVVVQCKVNEDCPMPLTEFQDKECLGYFKGCQNNKCVYDNTILNAPKCQNQVTTIVKQIEQVEKRTVVPITGTNIFTFSQNKDRSSFNIGDNTFTASMPQFLCSATSDTVNVPSPSSDCWKTTINYGGKKFEVKDSQSIFIDPIISVQYFAGGTYVINPEFKQANDKTPFRNDDWSNTFIFTVDTSNALNLNVEDSSFVIKDSIKKIDLSLINSLPTGEGIIKIGQRIKNINQNLPEQTIGQTFINGGNLFGIDMNTQNLGINPITIQSFYTINADTKVLIPSDKIILNYDVVNELPTVEKIITIEKEKIIFIQSKTSLWNLVLFVLIIVISGFLIWQRYSKR